jgi:hypothetical protein
MPRVGERFRFRFHPAQRPVEPAFCYLYGTDKSVPFQNLAPDEFFRKP